MVGGTGVLSSAVAAEARRKGLSVTMINRGNRAIPIGVEHIKADKNDTNSIAKALSGKRFDAIIDFLCYSDKETEKSITFYSKYTCQYFYISSCAVYKTERTQNANGNESSIESIPIWEYGVEKRKSENTVISLASKHNIHYTIIRPSITYGDTRIPYGIAPHYGYHWTLCARILAGKPIIRWNGGVNRCNMMRVEDFAVGVVGLIGNPRAYNEAFNICGDEAPSWNDVLLAMERFLGKKVITVDISPRFYATCLPNRYGEILGGRSIDAFYSNKKIKEVVPEFKQVITLQEGVAKTLSAYLAQNYQKGIDWHFDADTDRIIKKWCKTHHIKSRPFHLHFIDYLGTASLKDRATYLYALYQDSFIVRILKRIKKA